MLNTEETAHSFMVARTVDTAAAAHDQELNAQLLAINQLVHRSVSKLRAYGDTKRTILELLLELASTVPTVQNEHQASILFNHMAELTKLATRLSNGAPARVFEAGELLETELRACLVAFRLCRK